LHCHASPFSDDKRPGSKTAIPSRGQYIFPAFGELVFNIQISIWSTIPSDAVLSCSGAASVYEATSGHFSNETASVDATRNGNKASCQVIIPYYWSLLSPNTDQIDLTFSVETKSSTNPYRLTYQGMGTIPVPANGTITSKAFVARF
jgi:hypothetical protein